MLAYVLSIPILPEGGRAPGKAPAVAAVSSPWGVFLVGEGFALPREPKGLPYPAIIERRYSTPHRFVM